MVRVLMNVPRQVRRNEPFDVKLLISHPMESGQRRDATGQSIPRDIINSFVCTFNDQDVLRADFFPAIAANPFIAFSVVVQESGTLVIRFVDDAGVAQTERASISVA